MHPGARQVGPAAESRKPAATVRLGRRVPWAWWWFNQVTVLPVLLAMAWLVPGTALLMAGSLRPAPLVLISAPLTVILIAAVGRRVPGQRLITAPGAGQPRRAAAAWTGWWGLAGTIVAAAGFGAWQIWLNSPQVIVTRQPGALFQVGYWIAGHGSLPIPESLHDFGGAHPGLTFASTGLAATHGGLAPQFAPGLAIVTAGGWWIHGMTTAALVSPVLGALAVLTFGGLAGRLAGPQWAPPAAAVLAVTLPQQYTSRSAFAEPLAQLLLLGGLCLVADSLTIRSGRAWLSSNPGWLRWPSWLAPSTAAAALGGLALGLAALASLSVLPDLIPVIPFVGLLAAVRRPQALPLGLGVLAGAGYAIAATWLTAPAALTAPGFPVRQASLIAAAVAVATVAAVAVAAWPPARARAGRLIPGLLRWRLPEVAAGLAVAALIAFLIRPSVQTAHWHPGAGTTGYVGALQKLLGLPIQPTRSYAEDSLYWVIWYIGIPALLLAGFGMALLVRRCVRALLQWADTDGAARAWGLPLLIFAWTTVIVLWDPQTTPDQPWASRVLVPLVLPAFILCAVWVAAWLDRRARERGAGLTAVSLAAAGFILAMVVPTAVTTFGITLSQSGSGHSGPAATGLGVTRTGAGQTAAVQELCGSMSARMSVVILDQVAAGEFAQVIRGMCGVPVGVMAGAPEAEVQGVIRGIVGAGREPVLLATRVSELTVYGSTPRRAVYLVTTQDAHDLTQPPAAPWPITYQLWMSAQSTSVPGA
ncbi:MAG TPA: hypothetical protein VE464_00380 [Streptosporangiaceae bacterium]|nr:hypothetical protein [Streptosporangiaceae bacterium]